MSKQTVITISEDNMAEVSTTNRKWLKRLANLTDQGFAEEIESAMIGKTFRFDAKLLRLPFYREPREYTAEQRNAARDRLAKVREKAATKRAKAAVKAATATTVQSKPTITIPNKPAKK